MSGSEWSRQNQKKKLWWWRLRLQCCCEEYGLQRQKDRRRRIGRGHRQKKKDNRSHPIALGAHLDHLLRCSTRVKNKHSTNEIEMGGGGTYFLFLFEPPGSSTSIPSSSFERPALAAARLVAFCFSRRRSATSLSTTFRASSCWVSSRALTALCSASDTSFESSVWMSVAVVEDLLSSSLLLSKVNTGGGDEEKSGEKKKSRTYHCSKEVRIPAIASWGTSLPTVYSTSNCCSFWSSLPRMMSR